MSSTPARPTTDPEPLANGAQSCAAVDVPARGVDATVAVATVEQGKEEEALRAWATLSLTASGRPGLWLELALAFGGPSAVLAAGEGALRERGASAEAVALLRESASEAPRRLEAAARLGLRVTGFDSCDYPVILRCVPDPPLVLYWKGDPAVAASPAVALVGSRRCTAYGARVAAMLGREVAGAGVLVVSGLARGVDAAAHRGALERGRTAAVLAGGLDRLYPPEHRGLADRIVEAGGFLVSEQPPGLRPRPWLFPYRNRVLTGLCLATVVVEADARSGSLASARHALDQGREVFAVPGPIDSSTSVGVNRLLGQGASPLCRSADLGVVPGLSVMLEKSQARSSKNIENFLGELSEAQGSVLVALAAGAARADDVAAATALDGARVLALLTALELDGLVQREDLGTCRVTESGRMAAAELARRAVRRSP